MQYKLPARIPGLLDELVEKFGVTSAQARNEANEQITHDFFKDVIGRDPATLTEEERLRGYVVERDDIEELHWNGFVCRLISTRQWLDMLLAGATGIPSTYFEDKS